MITLYFDIVEDEVKRVRIDSGGYTGVEKAMSLKQALEFMTLENPCLTFSKKYRSGEYEDEYILEVVAAIADASNRLCRLWQYDFIEHPEGKDLCACMSPLQLLENTLNLVLEQQRIIDDLAGAGKVAKDDKVFKKVPDRHS